jgi:CHAT domain-containing protein
MPEGRGMPAISLNADWVVRSACNTAGAGDAAGGEALSGLVSSMPARGRCSFRTGPSTQMQRCCSLHTFVELRSNLAIGRSLSRAMLSVIEDRVRPDAAHPSFWAPFVFVGEGAAR